MSCSLSCSRSAHQSPMRNGLQGSSLSIGNSPPIETPSQCSGHRVLLSLQQWLQRAPNRNVSTSNGRRYRRNPYDDTSIEMIMRFLGMFVNANIEPNMNIIIVFNSPMSSWIFESPSSWAMCQCASIVMYTYPRHSLLGMHPCFDPSVV